MFDMHSFHQWLSSPTATPDVRRERLTRLAHADRERVLESSNQLTWYIWSEEQAPQIV